MTDIRETLHDLLTETREKIHWHKPRSVGTAQITNIIPSSSKSDMCFIFCGSTDITGSEFVFTPTHSFHIGEVVEVIISQHRSVKSMVSPGYPNVKVALRLYNCSNFGRIDNADLPYLAIMFEHPSNIKEPFYSRAFYRKFIDGAKENLFPFPDPEM